MNTKFFVTLAGVALSAIGTLAFAHAHIESASPAADSTVVSPKSIVLHFTMKIAPQLSGLKLTGSGGNAVKVKPVVVDSAGLTMSADIPQPLAPGVYEIAWFAVTPGDGHRSTGELTFTVK